MKLLKLVPDDTNIDFVALRKWAFGLTLLLSILAVGLTVARGLNYGVDFQGGLMIEEKFQVAPDEAKLRRVVDGLGLGDAQLQPVGDGRTMTIRLPIQKGADEGATNAAVKNVEAAVGQAFPGATFSRYSTVSGKVSDELIRNGVLAVVLAILGIGLFAIFRFEWQFGVSTVVAIVHDLLMTLGFFALTRFEFDLNIVAAVLTIIGYSINDKIVIDDRIRENMRRYRKMDMREIINLSVNETLPRTVMTSVTILLALFALLFLGGHVLRGFTAAMILGIFVGTYSSIYVSSSLLITLGLRAEPAPEKAARARPENNAERVAPREGVRIERDRAGAGPIVAALGPAGFRIDDRHYRAVLLTTTQVTDWSPPPLATLDEAALVEILDPAPEFVLIGTGATLVRPPVALGAALEARGIGIEAMDSRAAARAWGVLRGEGRTIGAALYPLDT